MWQVSASTLSEANHALELVNDKVQRDTLQNLRFLKTSIRREGPVSSFSSPENTPFEQRAAMAQQYLSGAMDMKMTPSRMTVATPKRGFSSPRSLAPYLNTSLTQLPDPVTVRSFSRPFSPTDEYGRRKDYHPVVTGRPFTSYSTRRTFQTSPLSHPLGSNESLSSHFTASEAHSSFPSLPRVADTYQKDVRCLFNGSGVRPHGSRSKSGVVVPAIGSLHAESKPQRYSINAPSSLRARLRAADQALQADRQRINEQLSSQPRPKTATVARKHKYTAGQDFYDHEGCCDTDTEDLSPFQLQLQQKCEEMGSSLCLAFNKMELEDIKWQFNRYADVYEWPLEGSAVKKIRHDDDRFHLSRASFCRLIQHLRLVDDHNVAFSHIGVYFDCFAQNEGLKTFLHFRDFLNALSLLLANLYPSLSDQERIDILILNHLESIRLDKTIWQGTEYIHEMAEPEVVEAAGRYTPVFTELFNRYRSDPKQGMVGVSLAHFIVCCQEFGLYPLLLSQHDVKDIYVQVARSSTTLQKGLGQELFTEALCRCAFFYLWKYGDIHQRNYKATEKFSWLLNLLRKHFQRHLRDDQWKTVAFELDATAVSQQPFATLQQDILGQIERNDEQEESTSRKTSQSTPTRKSSVSSK